MYQQVIVRTPAASLMHGLTSVTDLGQPDYQHALTQHATYVETLTRCGVEVTILPAINEFPDSCFVEDPVLLTEKVAILPHPGAPTRLSLLLMIFASSLGKNIMCKEGSA